ncbi:MAG: hypothetical protein RLZZ555_1142, partial [Pseudomonadota bacterium]|jgi:hypothetical protein
VIAGSRPVEVIEQALMQVIAAGRQQA